MKKLIALLLLFTVIMTGCSKSDLPLTSPEDLYNDGTEVVFDLGESQISYGKLLYFISYYELYGERVKEYYVSVMNYEGDYWNEMIDDTQTEADHYKDLVYQTACYYEAFKNEALRKGYTLTEEDIEASREYVAESMSVFTDKQIKKAGITAEGLIAARNTMVVANKYIEDLKLECAALPEFAEALAEINRDDYSTDEEYDTAVEEAKESLYSSYLGQIEAVMMNTVQVTTTSEIWDKVKMGTMIVE